MNLLFLFFIFITGFLTKSGDIIGDKKKDGKRQKFFSYVLGFLYGIFIAYIIYLLPILSPLAFGVIIAILITKKIDNSTHVIALASFILFLIYFGFPQTNFSLILIFLMAALIDEIGNDLVDKGKLKFKNMKTFLNIFFSYRCTLEITSFFISMFLNEWAFFFSLLSFDLGYLSTERVLKKFINIK
ncbi:MAG: hypothetical protein QW051_03850 [Candidatus Aenigmatarchaeota archaeon]